MMSVFQRRTTGSVVCPSCGSLVGVRDDKCYIVRPRESRAVGIRAGPAPARRRSRVRPARHRRVGDALRADALLTSRAASCRSSAAALSIPRAEQHARCCCSARAAPYPGVRARPLVDGAERLVAARRPAAHRLQHDVGPPARSGDGRDHRAGADGDHLHRGRRRAASS